MSAHVVPKTAALAASSAPDTDDDKTTIDSGWEDEASTTIEQGELAEKIRAIVPPVQARQPVPQGSQPGTSITSTNAHVVDEPTIDEQRASASPLFDRDPVPIATSGRLVITSGNDVGTALDVAPGKQYTIGRGLDNDLVLTDITTSRKHFDLRHEGGAWVVVDRGSGNGTLVNGSVEDSAFMLASGDVVEIGNTVFRFELQDAGPIVRPSTTQGIDLTIDRDRDRDMEDEPSTVAGKVPSRSEAVITPHLHGPAPWPGPNQPIGGPRFVPQPPQRAPTQPPPPLPRARPRTVAPAGASQSVDAGAVINTHFVVPPSGPLAAVPSVAMHGPGSGPASTLPLPQMSARAPIQPMHPPFGYAPGAGAGHGPAMLHAPYDAPPYDAPPYEPPYEPAYDPYGYQNPNAMGLPPPAQHGSQPMHHYAGPRDATSTGVVPVSPYQPMPYGTPGHGTLSLSRRTKLILGGGMLSLFAAIATIAIIKGTTGSHPTRQAVPTPAASRPAPASKPLVTPITPTPATPARKTPVTPKGAGTPRPTPVAIVATPVPRPAPVVPVPRPVPVAIAATPRPDQPVSKPDRPRDKPASKPDKPRDRPASKPDKPVASGNAEGARDKADAQYRARKFNDAAATLRAAAAGSDDASKLRSLAATYESMGKAFNVGMAPSTKPAEAYASLTKARNFDRTAGGGLQSDIETKLRDVAPRAAIALVLAKSWSNAFNALRVAEGLGVHNDSTELVRKKLEAQAAAIYNAAASALSANPSDTKAKDSLKQIKQMVDSSSPWAVKAAKLLAGT